MAPVDVDPDGIRDHLVFLTLEFGPRPKLRGTYRSDL